MKVASLVNDKMNGLVKIYYESGKVSQEDTYGKRHCKRDGKNLLLERTFNE